MPFDAEYYANPYPVYERLHTEGPVHRICTPDGAEAWLVIGYDEVMKCLVDRRFVRKRWYASTDFLGDAVIPAPVRHGNVIMEDPPEHTRLRRMMNHAFLPSRIELLRGHVAHEVDELLNAMAASAAANGGRADLMSELAYPLPVSVVADILGVPEEERPNFRGWANGAFGGTPERAQQALSELFEMVSKLVAARRAKPTEDFTSYLIQATDAKDQHLVEHEVHGM
ncbi:MAG: cytochrome P450, partial [Pseudonocardiaceae bacterium]